MRKHREFRIANFESKRNSRSNSKFEIRNSKLVLALLPFLLLSCGALWQTDVGTAIEQARTGKYREAAAALNQIVEAGNVDPQAVESLYYSWIRQGDYMRARDRFETLVAANPTAASAPACGGPRESRDGEFRSRSDAFECGAECPGCRYCRPIRKGDDS